MKILFVMEDSVPIENGCPIRNRYIMENLKKEGMEIMGLTSPFMRVLPGKITEGSEVINGITYYRSQYLNTINGVSSTVLRWGKRFQMFRRYCKLLETICLQEKPDLIHAITSYINGNAANKVGQKLNIPRLYEPRSIAGSTAAVIDGKSHSSFKYQTVWKLDKKAMVEATRIAPLSRVLKDELTKRGIPVEKMDVVHNGVDIDKIYPQERSLEITKKYDLGENTIVGYLGSIRKIEGLSLVVKAAPKVLMQYPNVKFMIIGEGDDLKNLKDLVRQNGVEDSFIFPGRVPHNQILQYYSVIDIVTIPRVNALVNQTITPIKPLEVMAAGKVALASDVGGLAELVQDGKTGVLFKAEDVDDLSVKMLLLLQDEEKRKSLGNEARDWVLNNRQWKDMARQYLPIYEKLLVQDN